ncbi:hypothetical protein BC831DRAFT_550486 [Entophlyctis helioformis]|nr:hypothetical protein BC831DRAFT_550486 [Entophlyctis helioformis]
MANKRQQKKQRAQRRSRQVAESKTQAAVKPSEEQQTLPTHSDPSPAAVALVECAAPEVGKTDTATSKPAVLGPDTVVVSREHSKDKRFTFTLFGSGFSIVRSPIVPAEHAVAKIPVTAVLPTVTETTPSADQTDMPAVATVTAADTPTVEPAVKTALPAMAEVDAEIASQSTDTTTILDTELDTSWIPKWMPTGCRRERRDDKSDTTDKAALVQVDSGVAIGPSTDQHGTADSDELSAALREPERPTCAVEPVAHTNSKDSKDSGDNNDTNDTNDGKDATEHESITTGRPRSFKELGDRTRSLLANTDTPHENSIERLCSMLMEMGDRLVPKLVRQMLEANNQEANYFVRKYVKIIDVHGLDAAIGYHATAKKIDKAEAKARRRDVYAHGTAKAAELLKAREAALACSTDENVQQLRDSSMSKTLWDFDFGVVLDVLGKVSLDSRMSKSVRDKALAVLGRFKDPWTQRMFTADGTPKTISQIADDEVMIWCAKHDEKVRKTKQVRWSEAK